MKPKELNPSQLTMEPWFTMELPYDRKVFHYTALCGISLNVKIVNSRGIFNFQ